MECPAPKTHTNMSLFNKLKNKRNTTTNHVGAKAYDHSAEYRLVSMLLTSFVQNSYYRSANEGANEMLELVKEVDPRFAAKAAIYARNEFGMRSSSHLLAAALSARASGTDWGRNFYDRIVRRPDDMLEILTASMVTNWPSTAPLIRALSLLTWSTSSAPYLPSATRRRCSNWWKEPCAIPTLGKPSFLRRERRCRERTRSKRRPLHGPN